MSDTLICDFNNADERATLYNALRRLRGKYRVEITKHRKRRSDRQARYYFPCFCKLLADFLRDQGEIITTEDAHHIFRAKFLKLEYLDEKTGEVLTYARSTTTLDTAEFNEYLDQIAFWLNDMFGLIVPEPNMYREKETTSEAA